MPVAVEVVRVCGCTVYDALFVALAVTGSEEGPALVTADERLMRSLESTPYASLVLALGKVGELL
jgi:predicted nucleic acid-binding protein